MRVNLSNKKENIWFTSDEHYHHKRILEYTDRKEESILGNLIPYENIEGMNEGLIRNHDSVVNRDDIVFHLGDFSWANIQKTDNILRRLNGTNILIAGNHDMKSIVRCDEWNGIYYYLEIIFKKYHLILFHYPIEHWNGKRKGSIHLRGHSHKDLETDGARRIEVGVDGKLGHGYPIHLYSIIAEVNRREDTLGKTYEKGTHHE